MWKVTMMCSSGGPYWMISRMTAVILKSCCLPAVRWAKGKKLVLTNKLGPQLGNYMIACVDADYDYLLQGATPTSRLINKNPFVFHTYAYAIENYQCYAATLHRVCVMATLNDRQIVDFESFMQEYSQIIWPLFVWSVWVYRRNHYREFTLTEFGNHVSFSDINVYHPEQTLELVRRRVNRKIAWLQRHFPQAKKRLRDVEDGAIGFGGHSGDDLFVYSGTYVVRQRDFPFAGSCLYFCCVKNVSVKSVIWPSTTHSGKTNCRVTNIARIPWKTCFGRM